MEAYPSTLTDAQWARIRTIFEPSAHSRGGRPRAHSARHLVNAILYVMKQGCAWRALPHDFPPWKTVYCAKNRWTNRIVEALAALRVSANPSVGILDSTFIESSYGGSQSAPNGYKRATGCGVHVLVENTSTSCPGVLFQDAGPRRLCSPAESAQTPLVARVSLGPKVPTSAKRQETFASNTPCRQKDLGTTPGL